LDDPESDPFRAAGTDPRHPLKLPDQFLQGRWIFYFAHGDSPQRHREHEEKDQQITQISVSGQAYPQ
jgi:hypothetical protein